MFAGQIIQVFISQNDSTQSKKQCVKVVMPPSVSPDLLGEVARMFEVLSVADREEVDDNLLEEMRVRGDVKGANWLGDALTSLAASVYRVQSGTRQSNTDVA
jgi:predicted amidophosphoribosyltransferase